MTEMPSSSGGDMSVSISPPCLWRCAHGGGRCRRRSGCCVCVPCCTPPPTPTCSSLGKGMEDEVRGEVVKETGGLLTGGGRGPSDFFLLTHARKHTLTPTHRACTCQSSCGRRLPGFLVSLHLSPPAVLAIAPPRRPLRQHPSSSGRLTARVLTCLTWSWFWKRSSANQISGATDTFVLSENCVGLSSKTNDDSAH